MAKSVTETTKKPTGVLITRNGNKFKCSWKIGDKNYGGGQVFYWSTDLKNWKSTKLGGKVTSKTVTVDFSKFTPTTTKQMPWVAFKIKGLRDNYTTGSGSNKTTHKMEWSLLSGYRLEIEVPSAPKVTVELDDELNNRSQFSWTTSTSDTARRIFTSTEWQSVLLKNSNITNGAEAFKATRVAGTYETGTGTANSSKTFTEDTSYINQADSYTRWFRIRARGPKGSSSWVYKKHVYARPYAATDVEAKALWIESGFRIDMTWQSSRNNHRPVDKIMIQYLDAIPGAGMAPPAGATWTDVMSVAYKDGSDGARFVFDEGLEDDHCLFVRVVTVHDREETPSEATIAIYGKLADPELNGVTPVVETHRATINAENKSSVPGPFLAVLFKSDEFPDEEICVGIITGTSTTVQCPDWGTHNVAFGVRACVGEYSPQTRDDGVTAYSVSTIGGMASDPVWDNGQVPVAPDGVSVTRTNTPGTVRVKWNNTWTEADSVELAWADHEDAWESTDPPSTYSVNNAYAAAWNIANLEVGKRWYFRVRLVKGAGESATPGPWSEIVSISLSEAPAIPALALSQPAIPADGVVTASWGYVSGDGTPQAYAEICTSEIVSGEIVYGEVIATVTTPQHIDLYAEELGWAVGDIYNLCVRVGSASGEVSEWSEPNSVMIAPPLTCTITQTSLVAETIEDNPREFAGKVVSFENTSEAGVATSLIADIDAEQDLNGYSSPWPGGGGKNKCPNTFNGSYSGITYEALDNGKVHASGTVTAPTWLTLAKTFSLSECGLKVGDTVTVSSGIRAVAQFKDAGNTVLTSFDSRDVKTATVPQDAVSLYVILYANMYVGTVGDTIDEELWVQVEIGTSVTSFVPFENICPITGWTDCEVTQTGFNHFNKNASGIQTNCYMTNTGTVGSGIAGLSVSDYIDIDGGQTYYFSQLVPNSVLRYCCWFNADKQFISSFQTLSVGGTKVAPTEARYIRITYATSLLDTICINISSSRNGEYKPYNNATTYTKPLGQTVYGGTLNIVSGVLTITHKYITLDGVTSYRRFANVSTTAGGVNWCYLNLEADKRGITSTTTDAHIISDQFNGYPYVAVGNCYVTNSGGTLVVVLADQSITTVADANTWLANNLPNFVYELATPTTTTLTAQEVELLLGTNNIWADTGDVAVRIADSALDVTSLKDMPLTVTVTGAGETGETTVAIERAESYYLNRPDERNFTGHEGETIALFSQMGEAQITISNEDLMGSLDDGAPYRLVATVQDGFGQSAEASIDFEVHWTHQAVMPEALVEIDNTDYIAKITPIAPTGAEEGDVCDIYRLSVDRPELIYAGAEFGTTYVDPFPALGEMGGHRIVFRTANGDYITEDNEIAWTDYTQADTGGIDTMYNIIDYENGQVQLMYDITLSSGWDKDFQETKYLGGHIQGDWNPAVSRSGNVGGAVATVKDQETIQAMRRLADSAGICHVRTRDGSSYAADVQVSESRDMGQDVVRAEFTLNITRVDPEGYEAMTLADWTREGD